MAFENNQDLYTLGISLLINVIFGVFILYSNRERKRIYTLLNDVNYSIKEKNEAIVAQSAKLAEAYENLWKVNQRLEEEVHLRTERIRHQHAKLIEYTHFNTHKLRGPLARILGLLHLTKKVDTSKEMKDLLEMMHASAHELDKIVRDFTHRLDDDR
ncbi:MAG TPA: histidine kinase dimerization/phospho-acceptor domain-containing protein [Chryseolinea sp.]